MKLNLIKPTQNQEQLICSIIENDLTICSGFSGTGKTLFSLQTAVNQLKSGAIDQIVIARTIVNIGKNIGSLPGSLKERIDPYYTFINDYLKILLDKNYQKYIKEEIIKIIPLEMMRGHTYDRAIMILEESQNATPTQIKAFITRMGKHSKCVVIGDVSQKDTLREENGLEFCIEQFDGLINQKIGVIKMDYNDIKRNDKLKYIIRVFDEAGY